jgi:hypothetical protein
VADAILVRWRGLTITRERAAQVGGLLVLLVLGTVLPYVTMEHYNARTELVRSTARLFGAGGLLNRIDPSHMPSYDVVVRSQMNLAFNVIGFAPGLQEIGTLVAAAACWACSSMRSTSSSGGRCMSGYLLVLVPIPLAAIRGCEYGTSPQRWWALGRSRVQGLKEPGDSQGPGA